MSPIYFFRSPSRSYSPIPNLPLPLLPALSVLKTSSTKPMAAQQQHVQHMHMHMDSSPCDFTVNLHLRHTPCVDQGQRLTVSACTACGWHAGHFGCFVSVFLSLLLARHHPGAPSRTPPLCPQESLPEAEAAAQSQGLGEHCRFHPYLFDPCGWESRHHMQHYGLNMSVPPFPFCVLTPALCMPHPPVHPQTLCS